MSHEYISTVTITIVILIIIFMIEIMLVAQTCPSDECGEALAGVDSALEKIAAVVFGFPLILMIIMKMGMKMMLLVIVRRRPTTIFMMREIALEKVGDQPLIPPHVSSLSSKLPMVIHTIKISLR